MVQGLQFGTRISTAALCESCSHLAGVSVPWGCGNLCSGLVQVSGGARWAAVAPHVDALSSGVNFCLLCLYPS